MSYVGAVDLFLDNVQCLVSVAGAANVEVHLEMCKMVMHVPEHSISELKAIHLLDIAKVVGHYVA